MIDQVADHLAGCLAVWQVLFVRRQVNRCNPRLFFGIEIHVQSRSTVKSTDFEYVGGFATDDECLDHSQLEDGDLPIILVGVHELNFWLMVQDLVEESGF